MFSSSTGDACQHDAPFRAVFGGSPRRMAWESGRLGRLAATASRRGQLSVSTITFASRLWAACRGTSWGQRWRNTCAGRRLFLPRHMAAVSAAPPSCFTPRRSHARPGAGRARIEPVHLEEDLLGHLGEHLPVRPARGGEREGDGGVGGRLRGPRNGGAAGTCRRTPLGGGVSSSRRSSATHFPRGHGAALMCRPRGNASSGERNVGSGAADCVAAVSGRRGGGGGGGARSARMSARMGAQVGSAPGTPPSGATSGAPIPCQGPAGGRSKSIARASSPGQATVRSANMLCAGAFGGVPAGGPATGAGRGREGRTSPAPHSARPPRSRRAGASSCRRGRCRWSPRSRRHGGGRRAPPGGGRHPASRCR